MLKIRTNINFMEKNSAFTDIEKTVTRAPFLEFKHISFIAPLPWISIKPQISLWTGADTWYTFKYV